MTSARLALLLLLAACSRTGVGGPEGAPPTPDAGTAEMWVYANGCRAIFDYFLVRETEDECFIATFGDRFFPNEGEPRREVADVTRGPAPCPPPNEYVEGYPAARTEVEVEVTQAGDALRARIAGTFPDGSTFDVDFVSSDGRDCCGCVGSAWPVRP